MISSDRSGIRRLLTLLTVLLVGAVPGARAADGASGTSHIHRTPPPHVRPGRAGSFAKDYKLDDEVTQRATQHPLHTSRVIVTLVPGAVVPPQFKSFVRGDKLDIINGHVLELPNRVLAALAAHPAVFRVHEDRDTFTHNYRTGITVGAQTVINTLGVTGRGIGVAVIDSGITTYHDDLTVRAGTTLYPYGNQRVAKFVDFVNGRALPYDDNGHGSHVAGTILGNGADSYGQKSGIAPDASLVALKVLDQNGQGKISNIIAALNWVALNATTYKIRVVNLSVGATIKESYRTDPLTLATKALTDRGIVVVAAAGNLGKNAAGHAQYGGITAPGNAPWVLTVGASSTQGTLTRADDVMATYSSRGPTFLDWSAKPDLVAPGTGTVSLAVPGSTFYTTKAPYLVPGTHGGLAYLALSGTSMAAPVVSGTVALMLQANPTLTPNLVKGILQYTAQTYPGYNLLTEGAGFLNTLGAVRLAKFYTTARPGDRVPTQKIWSRHLIWGNHLITGGILVPSKNAWGTNIIWGTAKTLGADGDNIIWGTGGEGDNIIWGTSDGDNIIWGTDTLANIIWGTATPTNIIWGTSGVGDNIIWGTADAENIIWGTECGGADCDVAWGTADLDNIIWGTANDGDNIIWGTSMVANIVWGTAAGGEDVTWGSSASDAEVFPDTATDPLPNLLNEFGDVVPVGGV
jgi:serine protease AprX